MLGLSENAVAWLGGLEPASDVRLPDDVEAARMLKFCGVSEQDRDDMLAARPDRSRDADWWTVLGAMVTDLDRGMDQSIEASGFMAWPVLSEAPVGSFRGGLGVGVQVAAAARRTCAARCA
ncbi:hypothetical protein E1218_10660 [Kribbella turkmenica]|uniref:Uncharacterized protein n=1 Tax=Kribbella turkmenica TaxID=2530375 RepID=A0A4R4XA47_9ACTN|nr:hypothetical protein [Kribbella turkmenica]TDD27436.1 hypothetical protein E1218_10660 [Kribbella turkmenica]